MRPGQKIHLYGIATLRQLTRLDGGGGQINDPISAVAYQFSFGAGFGRTSAVSDLFRLAAKAERSFSPD